MMNFELPRFYSKESYILSKEPYFYSKEPLILSREACAWHVELSVCKIFRLKSPTFWQKSPTICQKSPTINQRPVPDMLNFLIATRGKRACICGSFGCWCCRMLQCVAVCCSVRAHWNMLASVGVLAVGVAVCCSVLQCVGLLKQGLHLWVFWLFVLQCVAVCCSVKADWNVLASVGLLAVGVKACCSVLQCIAVCWSAVCWSAVYIYKCIQVYIWISIHIYICIY